MTKHSFLASLTTLLLTLTLTACSPQNHKAKPGVYNYSAYEGAVTFRVEMQAGGDLPQFWADEMAWRVGMAIANDTAGRLNIKGTLTGVITRACSDGLESYVLLLGDLSSSITVSRSGNCEVLPMAATSEELDNLVTGIVTQLVANLPPLTATIWDSPTATPPSGSAAKVREKLLAALSQKGVKGHFEGTLIYHSAQGGKPEYWLLTLDRGEGGHWLTSKEGSAQQITEALVSETVKKVS